MKTARFSQIIFSILNEKIQKGPLLLGCSGGPDSKALLYLLHSFCKEKGVELLVAHIDHAWRKESGDEAAALQKDVESLGWEFFLQTIDNKMFGISNWEGKGREIRLQFFSEIYREKGAEALFLGHHAGDLAEGVLKRLFEGASFLRLGGMSLESHLRGMRVLRPLLGFSKKQIVQYLAQEGISHFIDPTNQDEAFLRGRMRSKMLPFLEKSFGKNIERNLCLFASDMKEMGAYFSCLNQPLIKKLTKRKVLDLREDLPLPEIQLRHLIKELIEKEGVFLSREMIESASKILLKRGSGTLCSGSGGIVIRNGIISITN